MHFSFEEIFLNTVNPFMTTSYFNAIQIWKIAESLVMLQLGSNSRQKSHRAHCTLSKWYFLLLFSKMNNL